MSNNAKMAEVDHARSKTAEVDNAGSRTTKVDNADSKTATHQLLHHFGRQLVCTPLYRGPSILEKAHPLEPP
jgi:hypothetical protein